MAYRKVQISDFFGRYPSIEEPDFNTQIARKLEFSELKTDVREPQPPRGKSYKHQEYVVRYLQWYDRLLLIHDPGTGKSCIITHSAELFKEEYKKDPNDPTKIRKAIILVKGNTLLENIRHEIVCKCTDRVYETELVMRSSDKARKGNITRELSTWYDIKTYHEFAKHVKSLPEDQVEEYMSNVAIYVDEAHNIPTIEETKEDKIARRRKEDKSGTRQAAKKSFKPYDIIYEAFHKGKRNKIVLATATPMSNSPIDLIPLINLILPLDQQMPHYSLEREAAFADLGLEYFKRFFIGRVSYVRAMEISAVPKYVGQRIPSEEKEYSTYIYPCFMSDFQYKAYLAAKEADGKSRQQSFHGEKRQASNFVFPDGSYGAEGFDKYVEEVKGRYQIKKTEDGQELRMAIRKRLKDLSAKYHKILNICKAKFPDANVKLDDSRGVVFVYFADYTHGSGAIMFGLCLQEHGYEEFRETHSIFKSKKMGDSGPCVSESEDQYADRTVRIPKKKRYALLTGKTSPAQIAAILSTVNSYENRYGEYIQVLVGSRAAREGINVLNGVCMIMASCSWHASANWQAQERVFRSSSLQSRIEEKRRLTGREDDTIPIEVYNMVAVHEEDSATIDVQLYAKSEEKDRLIRKVMRYLKQCAIDCYSNYKRNVRASDVDGSSACDYLPCHYSCAGLDTKALEIPDRTTKILYYSDKEIVEIAEKVREVFFLRNAIHIQDLYEYLRDYDRLMVDMALDAMITSNVKVIDSTGYFGYIRESSNGTMYIEKDPFEVRSMPENIVYNSVLIGVHDPRKNTLADYIGNIEAVREAALVESIKAGNVEDQLETLSLVSKIELVEWAILEEVHGRKTPATAAIMDVFAHAIYRMPEPISRLRENVEMLANRGKSRGRKPNPNTEIKIKKIRDTGPTAPEDVGEEVYLHTLAQQSRRENDTSYGETAQYLKAEGPIRILKPSEGVGWRNVNNAEYITYNERIQHTLNEVMRRFDEKAEVYGIMLPPRYRLRIRDQETENKAMSSKDARAINDGRICTTWQKSELVGLLYRLKYPIDVSGVPKNIKRSDMVAYLNKREDLTTKIRDFTDDKLKYYYVVYKDGYTRDQMCKMLLDFFVKKGLLYTGRH